MGVIMRVQLLGAQRPLKALLAYANAFEFGPRDFDAGEILPPFTPQFPPIGLWVLGGLTLGFAPNF